MRAMMVTPDVLHGSLLGDIAREGGVRLYPAHAVLINEGDDADTLFVILSGRVKVYSTSSDGKDVVIATHGAGEYVGELSLDRGLRRPR